MSPASHHLARERTEAELLGLRARLLDRSWTWDGERLRGRRALLEMRRDPLAAENVDELDQRREEFLGDSPLVAFADRFGDGFDLVDVERRELVER